MKRSAVLAIGIAAAAVLGTTSLAFATPPTGPDAAACTDAKARLATGLALVVDYNPNVYPGDKTPAVADVDRGLLDAILADTDLGGDARVQVEAAVAAMADVDRVCAPPAVEPTVTPTPPTTTPEATTTMPTTTPEATTTTSAPQPTLNPGTDDDFDQVGTPPAGGVDTGAR